MAKIVIFGAGIAGCLTAISLAKLGISSIVIEKKPLDICQNPDDLRTTALTKFSTNFLKKIGVWSSIEQYSTAINDIYVCKKESDNLIHFNISDESMGYMIENIDLRREVLSYAMNLKLIEFRFNSEYSNLVNSSKNIEFNIGNEVIKADYAIVAEGRNSFLRNQFFSNYIEKDYCQSAFICNINHSINHEFGAIEHFLPRGPFATLPLKDGYKSSIVWTEETDVANMLHSQEDSKIERLMERFSGGALGKIKIASEKKLFPLKAFFSKEYYSGRLILIADSAHVVHPLAGQGLNLGIKDIEYLAGIFKDNYCLGLEISHHELSNYQNVRIKDNYAMFQITDKINSIFSRNFFPLDVATELSFKFLDKAPFMKQTLIEYAMGKRMINL